MKRYNNFILLVRIQVPLTFRSNFNPNYVFIQIIAIGKVEILILNSLKQKLPKYIFVSHFLGEINLPYI